MHVLSMRMVRIGHFVEYVIMIWEKTGFSYFKDEGINESIQG